MYSSLSSLVVVVLVSPVGDVDVAELLAVHSQENQNMRCTRMRLMKVM